MYTQFTQTPDDGYLLKKQGMSSVFIIGGILGVLSIFLFVIAFKETPADRLLIVAGLLILFFTLTIFLAATRKCIVYPSRRIIRYSKNFLSGAKDFSFDEYDGPLVEVAKRTGITVGNSLKLTFTRNEKYKDIELGRNLSVKTRRAITEELHQLMGINRQ